MDANSISNRNRGSQIHEPTPDTKYHARRREDMRTRIKQYGFYAVSSGLVSTHTCSDCRKDLIGSFGWIKINGSPICDKCLNARN